MLEDQEQKKKQQQMRCIYRAGLARNDHPISRAATQWRNKCRTPEVAGDQNAPNKKYALNIEKLN